MNDGLRPSADRGRDDMRRWLDTWRGAGALLDEERWQRVAALTDEQAWNEAVGLLAMWEPAWTGDAGEGLLRQQDVFAHATSRRAR